MDTNELAPQSDLSQKKFTGITPLVADMRVFDYLYSKTGLVPRPIYQRSETNPHWAIEVSRLHYTTLSKEEQEKVIDDAMCYLIYKLHSLHVAGVVKLSKSAEASCGRLAEGQALEDSGYKFTHHSFLTAYYIVVRKGYWY